MVELIHSKSAGSMSAVLVGVDSFESDSQVFFLFYYSLCEWLYLGELSLVTVS